MSGQPRPWRGAPGAGSGRSSGAPGRAGQAVVARSRSSGGRGLAGLLSSARSSASGMLLRIPARRRRGQQHRLVTQRYRRRRGRAAQLPAGRLRRGAPGGPGGHGDAEVAEQRLDLGGEVGLALAEQGANRTGVASPSAYRSTEAATSAPAAWTRPRCCSTAGSASGAQRGRGGMPPTAADGVAAADAERGGHPPAASGRRHLRQRCPGGDDADPTGGDGVGEAGPTPPTTAVPQSGPTSREQAAVAGDPLQGELLLDRNVNR